MNPKILIVEDEPAIADALQFVLQSEGFVTHHTTTLQNTRHALTQLSFDLIVLDIGLPDGSGFDLCRELQAQGTVPILFLSARHEEVDRILGLELGADDYVSKPFSPREVAARIRAILRRKTRHSPCYSVEPKGIYADLQKACAYVHGQKVELTPNELRLLHQLQMHPGQVFSREQLMQAVWEQPGSATERTVDAHIKTLRKKIPQAPITTHRGFGYSWQLLVDE